MQRGVTHTKALSKTSNIGGSRGDKYRFSDYGDKLHFSQMTVFGPNLHIYIWPNVNVDRYVAGQAPRPGN